MDCDKLLSLGTELGCLLMSSGAEIYRAEESVNRLLAAYGLEPQVFAIPNCLFVSVITPGGQSINRMCRIPAHGTDIELLERCNGLCRWLCRERPPVEEALALVRELKRGERRHTLCPVFWRRPSGLSGSRSVRTGGGVLPDFREKTAGLQPFFPHCSVCGSGGRYGADADSVRGGRKF